MVQIWTRISMPYGFKLPYIRRHQPTRGSPGDNASTMSYCLLLILERELGNDVDQFLQPKLTDMDVYDSWFQQDGTTPHSGLHDGQFESSVISRKGHANWTPRLFDWGILKSQVYTNKPPTNQSQYNPNHCLNSTGNFIIRALQMK